MTATLQPIDTRYSGHLFRSRLEARWAVAFDTHNLKWDYEPEGFVLDGGQRYLPDFWLPQVRMWAEVKPERPTIDEQRKAHALANQSGHPVLLLIGKPSYGGYWAIEPDRWASDWRMEMNERLDDGTPVFASDHWLFGQGDYHLTENRFFANMGLGGFLLPVESDGEHFPQDPCPIAAALSARFEHGA